MVDTEIMERLQPLLDEGVCRTTSEGAFRFVTNASRPGPFLFKLVPHRHRCLLWFHVMAETFGFVPSPCRSCWKTVVYPRDVEELFRLYDLQQGLDHLSKCGMEMRPYVPADYAGYFYHSSREEALADHPRLEAAVRRELGQDTQVFLKRACTELTMRFGDPDGWRPAAEEPALEQRIARLFADEVYDAHQPPEVARQVQRDWVLWAYRRGDRTYTKYLDSFDIFSDYILVPGDGDAADLQFAVLQL